MFVYEYLTAIDCESCSLQKCRFAFVVDEHCVYLCFYWWSWDCHGLVDWCKCFL